MHAKHDHGHPPSVFALNVPRRALLALACLLLGVGPAAAATYYVTTGGSDTNAGTQALPWRTLAKANATLVAGDVCRIAAGTYTDNILPAVNGSAGARISYVGSLASPTSVVVGGIYINRAYITVKGVRTTGGSQLYYTSETAKPVRDSIAYCIIGGSLDFWGAKDCMVARNTINGPVAFVMNSGNAMPPGVVNSSSDTLRGNIVNIGTIANKGFLLRGFTQSCVIDSNRVSGLFAVANGGDIVGRYLYNSYYNTFRDNSWRFEADGAPTTVGKEQFIAFGVRDSSHDNLFERDSMYCGVVSGFDMGGRLCSTGTYASEQSMRNHWKGCVFQTTSYVFNQDKLDHVIIENTVFASSHAAPLWLLSAVQNTIIRNCTFFAWTSPALRADDATQLGGNEIYSNIFYSDSVTACSSAGRPVLVHRYGTDISEDHNVFYARTATAGVTASSQAVYWASSTCSPVGAGTAWANATGNDVHSKWGAPLFVDDRWATFDPHLRAGSAAIGAAQDGGDAGAYPFVAAGGDVTPPAAVTNLAVVQANNDYALLSWTAPGDNGMTGTVAAYDLRYSTQPINEGNFAAANQVPTAPAILPAGSAQSYGLTGLTASTTYYFALKARDAANNWSAISNVPTAGTTATDQLAPARITDLH